nr:hypothetical protein [Angustibacter aerolatus]
MQAALVRVGLEEEALHGGDITGPVVVGRVVERVPEPQKNGKTINWCQVDVGAANGGVRGIVCGAHNFDAGDHVVVSLPGAVLPGGFAISARKTYGHVSDGMICGSLEPRRRHRPRRHRRADPRAGRRRRGGRRRAAAARPRRRRGRGQRDARPRVLLQPARAGSRVRARRARRLHRPGRSRPVRGGPGRRPRPRGAADRRRPRARSARLHALRGTHRARRRRRGAEPRLDAAAAAGSACGPSRWRSTSRTT